jgi:hypothetical protein
LTAAETRHTLLLLTGLPDWMDAGPTALTGQANFDAAGERVGQLVGVHGIGHQYLGPEQILQSWRPALVDGLAVAAGQVDLRIAFYGGLFRDQQQDGSKGLDEDEAQLQDLEPDEIADLTEAVEDIVPPADLAAAEAATSKGAWLPVPAQKLVATVERRFPARSGVLFLGNLRQVRKYLRDLQLKAQVDDITSQAAGGATILVGHSLGSVVAYEFLRQNPGHSVKMLLTVGSPLGLRMVRDRLPAGDPSIARWVNVRDPNDPVTAAGALDRWYPSSVDRLADNGSKPHKAERYLCSKAVGAALAEAIREFSG